MIYEYAISPALFSQEDRIALMVSSLGLGHGRLVSDLPKDKWEQFALHFIKSNAQGDAQLAAWKEALFSLKNARRYSGGKERGGMAPRLGLTTR